MFFWKFRGNQQIWGPQETVAAFDWPNFPGKVGSPWLNL